MTRIEKPTIPPAAQTVVPVLFSKIDELADQSSDAESFVSELLPLVCSATHAVAGCLWMPSVKTGMRCKRTLHIPEKAAEEPDFTEELVGNVLSALHSAAVDIVEPCDASDQEAEAGPGRELLQQNRQLILPFCHEQQVVGVLVIFQPRSQVDANWAASDLLALQQRIERCYERLVVTLDPGEVKPEELARVTSSDHLVRLPSARSDRYQQVVRLANVVSRGLDDRQVAYNVVSELHAYFGEGRISLADFQGQRCRIRAISNQQTFDRRSAVVKALTRLATKVASTRKPLWHPEDQDRLPQGLRQLFDRYYEVGDTQSVALIPLIVKKDPSSDPDDLMAVVRDRDARPGKLVGVLIVEGIQRSLPQNELMPLWSPVAPTIVNAVANARTHNGLFLMPLWRAVGLLADLFRGHHRNKAIAAVILLLGLGLFLSLYPGDHRLRCMGAIQPARRSRVFAEVEGVIDDLLVKEGEWVEAGQTLMTMSNPELEADTVQVEGELREAVEQLRTARLQRLRSEFASMTDRNANVRQCAGLMASVAKLKERYQLLLERRQQLKVVSPVSGQVVTWDLPRRLGSRPVQPGQRLLTIADSEGPWELELKLPDRRSGHLRDAWLSGRSGKLQATYVLASHPTDVRAGVVREVSRSAELDEKEGNVVRVYVDLDEHPAKSGARFRPGTEVIAHLHVGTAPIGYCKSYELIDWFRRVWFTYV